MKDHRQIHVSIANEHLPECLKRKAVFGDREQIDALQNLETVIKKNEEFAKKKAKGLLKKYSVTIEFARQEDFEVWAENEEKARQAAEDQADGEWGFEIDSIYAREIKPSNPKSVN